MADYIETDDIRDKVYAAQVLDADIEESTTYFNDFAVSKGVSDTTDISTPVHYQIKELLVYFVQKQMAEARMGTNPGIPIRTQSDTNAFEGDIHWQKYQLYKELFNEAEQRITKEMILGEADTPQEYHATSFSIYRS